MVVNADGTEYTSIPEDGKLIFDQISLTLYRASMFHEQPYNNWSINLSKEEIKSLQLDSRINQTLGSIDVMNRIFKSIPIKVFDEDLS